MKKAAHTHPGRHAIANRLARIEGHVRKIRSMLAEDRDCPDILVQLAAVRAAVDKVCQAVLEDHVESCLIGPASGRASRRDVAAAWKELKRAFDLVF